MTLRTDAVPVTEPLHSVMFEIAAPHGGVIRGDAVISRGATTGVVLLHGFKGFARWALFPYLAQRVALSGLSAVAFDFSGSGIGADRESFTEPAAFRDNCYTRELADVRAVVAHATDLGWIGERYGVFGHSRGGGVAVLHAARDPRVAALVTWAAIATVERWSPADALRWREAGFVDVPNTRTGQVYQIGTTLLEEVERAAADELNILKAASTATMPRWLIVHGTNDETVPADEARALAAAAPAGRARLDLVEGANHVLGAIHPLSAPTAQLEQVADDTVNFLRATLE